MYRERECVARLEAGVLRRCPDERPHLAERLVVEPPVALGRVLAEGAGQGSGLLQPCGRVRF